MSDVKNVCKWEGFIHGMMWAPHKELDGHAITVLSVEAKPKGKVAVFGGNVACIGQRLTEEVKSTVVLKYIILTAHAHLQSLLHKVMQALLGVAAAC